MLQLALLVAALSSANPSSEASQSPIQRCFSTMEGAVYHGDPTDRESMNADVATCKRARIAAQRTRVTATEGPEKLFITARILDRTATLSYMGLDDATNALPDVRLANLYFRIAAGLQHESADYHAAAMANLRLTSLQLQTLDTDIAAAKNARATSIASRP